MSTSLYVCTTCRAAGQSLEPREERAGFRLWQQLAHKLADRMDVEIIPVECLSVCQRPCTIALSEAGKWTYIYGDLPQNDESLSIIATGLELYQAADDGISPWKLRPQALKKGVVARVPPLKQSGLKESQP